MYHELEGIFDKFTSNYLGKRQSYPQFTDSQFKKNLDPKKSQIKLRGFTIYTFLNSILENSNHSWFTSQYTKGRFAWT